MRNKISFNAPFFVIPLTITFQSCKKSTLNHSKKNPDKVQMISGIPSNTLELLKARIKKEGKSYTVQINEKVDVYYSDPSGKKISDWDQRTIISSCTGFTDAYSTPLEYKQSFDCTYGYKLY